MKSIIFTIAGLFILAGVMAQSLYFPPVSGNEWETVSPDELGWCTDKIEDLYDFLEYNNSKAFILLKDGRIVLEKYFGTFNQDSIWYWASAGKVLTAFLVGIAQQEGKLSINDTTSDYLGLGWTSLSPQQEEKITIRHQLTMTSGLDDNVPDPYCTLPECLLFKADAGARWAYHNAPYTLLDGVLQSATGLSLNIYLNQKIKTPTGINGLFVPVGYNMVYFSNARSMARFGLLVLANGNWNGNQIMTDMNYFTQMINTSQDLNKSYGYLWWLNGKESFMIPQLQLIFPGWINPNAPPDMIAGLGKNGQLLNVAREEGLVFIRMGNAPEGGEIGLTLNDSTWYYLNHIMCNASGNTADNDPNISLNIYPNPSSGIFKIHSDQSDLDYSLADFMGRVILEGHIASQEDEINLRSFHSGVYFLILRRNGQVSSRKLVIVKP